MEAEHILSAAGQNQFPTEDLPEFAFLGRSNVGKSSLLNCLVGHKGLAFTSANPGCTQLINFYRVQIPGGGMCRFVDLPGYGYARVPLDVKARWKSLIESYLVDRKCLEAAIILLDSRRGWMEPDRELREWLEYRKLDYLVVATKVDKLNQKEEHHGLAAIREEIADRVLLPFSAVNGRGAREIWQAIRKTKNK
jgi:GTP-binding protein